MKLKALPLAFTDIFAASAANALDFGQKIEAQAKAESLSLFGTLSASSTLQVSAATAQADPLALIDVSVQHNITVHGVILKISGWQ